MDVSATKMEDKGSIKQMHGSRQLEMRSWLFLLMACMQPMLSASKDSGQERENLLSLILASPNKLDQKQTQTFHSSRVYHVGL